MEILNRVILEKKIEEGDYGWINVDAVIEEIEKEIWAGGYPNDNNSYVYNTKLNGKDFEIWYQYDYHGEDEGISDPKMWYETIEFMD